MLKTKTNKMQITNPFKIESEAVRYQKYRPQYHHIPFNIIRNYVGKDFESSLDVACGTGHSTFALAGLSQKTVGCDLSEAMLNEARKNFEIEFLQAGAEDLPFENSNFDLLNISMGFHWVEQGKFLKEAKRVLKKNGYLSIDNYGFLGQISQDAARQKRHYDFFEEYLTSASKRSGYPTQELIQSVGFELVKEIKYDHQISLSSHEFVNLIMTWSNFQILEGSQRSLTARKMKEVYDEIFNDKKLELEFGGKTLLYKSTI